MGPEVGTTYRIRVDAIKADTTEVADWIDTNVGSVATWVFDVTSYTVPTGTVSLRFTVTSVRGGYESWQSPSHTVILFSAPSDLFGVYQPLTAPDNLLAYNVN